MSDPRKEGEERGFRVIDRRGERAAESEGEVKAPAAGESAAAPALPSSPHELPKIDFSTFALSLATSALYHLGLIEDPETGQRPQPNLPLAHQTIDTLEMLEEKTRGNLGDEESKLLQSLLYELRMHWVNQKR